MANIRAFTAVSSNKDVVRLVMERVKHTVDAYGDYFRTLLKFHRYYLSANERPRRPEPPDIDDSGREWRANIFVPYSFGTIEASLPRLFFALFGQRPYGRMVGREMSDQGKADVATTLLDYDMEMAKVDEQAILGLKSLLKFGLTVGRVGWRHEIYEKTTEVEDVRPVWDLMGNVVGFDNKTVTVKETKVKYDHPTYDPISVFNFFPDPLHYEIPEMRYVAELQVTSVGHLIAEDKGFHALTGKHLYKNLDRLHGMGTADAITRAGTWLGDSKEETAEIFGFGHGLNTRFNKSTGGTYEQDLLDDEVWIIRYWEPDRHIVIANGLECIRDGENPFDDQEVPYFAANCFPIEFEFYGMGMLHPVQGLQEEMNAWRSIAIDQGKLNMMQPIAYDAEAGLTDLDFDIYPGSATPVRFESGKPLAVPLFPRGQLPAETYQMEGMLQRDWQNALGMNDYMIGGSGGNAGTASEAAMINASSATRFKLQAFLGQKRFLQRMALKMFSRRQQFMDEEQVFRILGREGFEYPVLSPEDIQGQYDYMITGAVTGPNAEVERTQLIQFVTSAAANPVMAQRINWDEILEELVKKFDFPFAQRFILPPNKKSLSVEQIEYLLQIAMKNQDHNLIESLMSEMQQRQAMTEGKAGGQGGLGAAQMSQGVAHMQGAGQMGSPSNTTPTAGNLHGETFGGPGT